MLQPAPLTLHFQLTVNPAVDAIETLDLAQVLSLINRRGYSQEYEYAVAGVRISSTKDLRCLISTLPRTWAFANAHTKSKAIWDKMNEQVLEDQPSMKQTWAGFKIFFDDTHETAGANDNMIPWGYITALPTADYEWFYSKITVPNDPQINHHLIGIGDDTATSFGIIKGYADSRSRPSADSPNHPVDETWMLKLFDAGEQLDDLETVIGQDGDSPPYLIGHDDGEEEYYPGGANTAQNYSHYEISRTNIRTGQLGGRATAPGFTAMCGLVRFALSNQDASEPPQPSTVDIFVDLVPGNYKGYAALPMKDVN
jgi:hypothetical protein